MWSRTGAICCELTWGCIYGCFSSVGNVVGGDSLETVSRVVGHVHWRRNARSSAPGGGAGVGAVRLPQRCSPRPAALGAVFPLWAGVSPHRCCSHSHTLSHALMHAHSLTHTCTHRSTHAHSTHPTHSCSHRPVCVRSLTVPCAYTCVLSRITHTHPNAHVSPEAQSWAGPGQLLLKSTAVVVGATAQGTPVCRTRDQP